MNSNEKITMIYLMFVLVGIPVLFFILIVWGIPWIIRQLTYEVCTYKTIIIDDKADVIFSQGRYLVNSSIIYLLSFKFEDEEIIQFSLPRKEYKKHHIGDVGELTFQGDKFISFIKIQD
ncbi:DUF2500 domain-containing protein [Clostridium tagluense]|uniref:DUF2500 family protein n=1 Tax=Clostridium tagluense TaxID=360422 RepID=UPI001CF4E3C8|nr:DUF2500 family protein [Clostridium tagluense]MCB2312984.1 DUF2500 domain-containing protein [Clostridium tagluense]MCB2317778.1 DUF2500 domain-containing protein [Clostridium tagluense]MCB2322533.1 DUF2500 domain-containing protein [Clostridium tagluense]MCB2327561.1 DUF2500 domain-containing protein [Clostridium tagluense]MCB2332614.1 DUF2500 domain-containing protein [Clostridium tagluense]